MKSFTNIVQKSEEWHHIRKGKITGTTLKAIMSSKKDTRQDALYEVIAERLTVGVEAEMEYESDIDRGNRLEPEAIAMFELETGKKVETVGYCESDESEFIANSPDGIISETEAVEVKCPAGKGYAKAWLTGQVPEMYAWQVVQYFVVNKKLEKLYFVLYNPTITVHPMHILEVTRESQKDLIEQAEKAQDAFLAEVDKELSKIIKL